MRLCRKPRHDTHTELDCRWQVVGAVGWGDARLQIPVGSHPALASLILRCAHSVRERGWCMPRHKSHRNKFKGAACCRV